MSEVDAIMVRMTAEFQRFQVTIADRIMPPLKALGHEMHAWWFETLPWYRRWWHVMVAHRRGLREFTAHSVSLESAIAIIREVDAIA